MIKFMPISAILFILMIPRQSFAQYGSSYDWKTGNSYRYNTDSSGNTTVRGYNIKNGSMWNTRVDSSGSMRGTDSQGNYWNYNSSSGNYYNYGTGQSCFG